MPCPPPADHGQNLTQVGHSLGPVARPVSAHVTSEGDGSSLALMDVSDFTVADRIGMDDLHTRYATAIDSLDWELLDAVFTNDAPIDYRSSFCILRASRLPPRGCSSTMIAARVDSRRLQLCATERRGAASE